MGVGPVAPQQRVTELLRRWSAGDEGAFEEAVSLVYEDLRRIARRKMAAERRGHTLQPTALVNEAIARVMKWDGYTLADRAHFIRAVCLAMRRVLVDYARKRAQAVQAEVSLAEGEVEIPGESGASVVSAAALSQALDHLAAEDPKASEVATLRLFAELTLEEIAEVTGGTVSTVHRKWVYSKAFLRKELSS